MVQAPSIPQTLYPDSDGKPMADNTMQYRWIVRLVSNLKRLLQDQIAFVAGDLLWYPTQVDTPPVPSQAPDSIALARTGGAEVREETAIALWLPGRTYSATVVDQANRPVFPIRLGQ